MLEEKKGNKWCLITVMYDTLYLTLSSPESASQR